jgi:hypothetical protein
MCYINKYAMKQKHTYHNFIQFHDSVLGTDIIMWKILHI